MKKKKIMTALFASVALAVCMAHADDTNNQMPPTAQINQKMQELQQKINTNLQKVPTDNNTLMKYGNTINLSEMPKQSVVDQKNAITDIEQIIKTPAKKKQAAADVMEFVSLSMPKATLHALAKQARARNVVLVMRGIDGGWKRTLQIIADINKGANAEWEIDPPLFKKFDVKEVPVLVVASTQNTIPSQNGCSPDASYNSVAGDISIDGALGIIARKGTKAIAAMAQKRLEQ